MCGIVAAIAGYDIVPVLLEGLNRLEYRGYDSAGIALIRDGNLQRLRSVGRVAELSSQVSEHHVTGVVGIAHTRWATHGVPSERNAHPHISEGLALVHNGIIENHKALKERLEKEGYIFTSETDTEVVAHLITSELKKNADLFVATRQAISQLQGAYAIAVLKESEPDRIIIAREGSPLLIGLSDEGCFAASDTAALLQVTRRIVYLENGDCAEITRNAYTITTVDGTPLSRPETVSMLSADAVELGQFRHFMQKEIFEQPVALSNTLEMLGTAQSLQAGLFGAQTEEIFKGIKQVLIIACGTSYYAGLVAHYWIESVAGIPCRTEVASEYRYRVSVPDPETLVVTISQSGETADTLAALAYARSMGMNKTLCICNVPESSLVRESLLRFITRAGPEIGVASTKAFTTQLSALYLMTLLLAKVRGKLSSEHEAKELQALRHLPLAVSQILELETQIQAWSARFAMSKNALFLGRGMHYPIALEGALKLKEISYIHAEAYPAGELKHGPLALVDKEMPVVAVAPNDDLLKKLKSNLQEVRARGGELFVFAHTGAEITEEEGVHVIHLPEYYGQLSPLLFVVPLQLLAYHVALVRGTDVDKPRNLAKSVTVE